jgi:GT2 family glycosyltransferase
MTIANQQVSVVIPCYNHAHFLGGAIESVLSQTYPHFELIVVDDGSQDCTSEVAARYSTVRLIRQRNQGLSAARNTGLRASKGDYLVFLDADDRLLPNALRVGLDSLNAHPECVFVSGHVKLIAYDGSPLRIPQEPCVERDHYLTLLRTNYIWTPGVIIYRRALFNSVGDFNTSLAACEDLEFSLRVARRFPIYCHDQVVLEYRQHDANMSNNSALMLRTHIDVLRSQRKFVKGNEPYEVALKRGIKVARDDYGERLASEVQNHLSERRWGSAAWGMWVLLRYYPQALTRYVGKDSLSKKMRLPKFR